MAFPFGQEVMSILRQWLLLVAGLGLAQLGAQGADLLPTGELPPGKAILVGQPHHDDHTTDHGLAGLIARFVDEGYRAIYIRSTNDEKDGPHGYPRNDIINLRETEEATAALGMEKVIPLNWRNNFETAGPLNELREQLIFLIRKYKPEVVLGHNAWEHYQKNPGHRSVAWALEEAFWLAGYRNVHPEHFEQGLEPHEASYHYGKARLDWGLGHRPNIVMEFNAEQQRRKLLGYRFSEYAASPEQARLTRADLARRNLYVPEFEGLDDEAAGIQISDWWMDYVSRLHGSHAGVTFGEEYYFMDEFYELPGLKPYLERNVEGR
jgi:LmbE family N-acetylglucosaminyl deacetylase